MLNPPDSPQSGRLTLADLRAACSGLPGTQETFPFGLETLVFKVGGKMYALTSLGDDAVRVSLKVTPAEGEALRAAYPGIQPGYHLNKRHWVTVDLGGNAEHPVPAGLALRLLRESHALVVAGLTRAAQAELVL